LNKKLTCSSAKTVVLSFLASFQLWYRSGEPGHNL
jgi:hypothetical protein